MKIEAKIGDKIDLGLIVPAFCLFVIGLLAIYSSTLNHPTAHGNFQKQLILGSLAVVIFFITYSLPVATFKMATLPSYFVSIFFLLVVLVVGRRISGAKSWIDLGPMGFQPSEFAKIATILTMSLFLSKNTINMDKFVDIAKALAIGMFPVLLILAEPDMGSSFVYFGIMLVLLFWRGISLFALFIVLSPGIVALASLFGVIYFLISVALVIAALFYFKKDLITSGSLLTLNLGAGFFTDFVYKALSPHQQKRILSFIDPYSDPLGSGYNAIQAKVAIGSGGIFGKGFLQGNQTQLQFIPEQWTDFIYCVIGEEFGFLGSIVVLVLYFYMLSRILKIASSTTDQFLSLVCIGIFTVYLVHILVNVGMVLGIMPVIGIPLPFVSYGGTSLILNMFMLGIVANIGRTRKNYA